MAAIEPVAFNRPSRQLTIETKAITNSRPRLHAGTVDTHAEIVQPRLRVRRPQVKRPRGSAIGDQGRAHDGRRLTSASRSRMRHPHRGSRRKFGGQSGSTLESLLTPSVGQTPVPVITVRLAMPHQHDLIVRHGTQQ